MIDPAIESMLTETKEKFLIPANLVANVLESNNLYHAFLVLTKNHYAKIVVLDHDGNYNGLLSLSMITDQMLDTEAINVDKLSHILVRDIMDTEAPTVKTPYDVENNLRLLTDNPFLPVVDEDNEFQGIVTRRELFKSVNRLVHNFSERYEITKKNEISK